jgi:hypothetical protein
MIHYRMIASVWLLIGVLGFITSLLDCFRLFRAEVSLVSGDMIWTFIIVAFCALVTVVAMRLFRARKWARIVISVLAMLLCFYSLLFIKLAGLRWGVAIYCTAWFGVAFVIYTLAVIWILRAHEPAA